MGHYDHPLVIVFVNFKNRTESKHCSHNNLLNMAENYTYTDSTSTTYDRQYSMTNNSHTISLWRWKIYSVMCGTAVLCRGQCAKT